MREKYESLPLIQLRELAKVRGLKGASTMKKADVIELMLAEDERIRREEEKKGSQEEKKKDESGSEKKHRPGRSKKTDAADSGKKDEKNIPEEKAGRGSTDEGSSAEESAVREESVYKTEVPVREENPLVREKPAKREKAWKTDGTVKSEDSSKNDRNETAARTDNSSKADTITKPETAARIEAGEPEEEGGYPKELDSGVEAHGILEVMPDGYGFIRCENYLPGENDVYVAPSQIRRFALKTGDILNGNKRVKTQQEKFSALLYINTVNGFPLEVAMKRPAFENMTPIFPDKRIKLETPGSSIAMRVMDLVSPVGKGQRGMIVSPPKAGKTTLLKEVAKSVLRTNPKMHMLILLIDERPEEVTDIKEAIHGDNVEVIYSTFDELPEHHKRVSEMVIERAKRLVEHKMDVVILLDSITRLTRAYNQVVPPSGRTLSGGLDPSALHMPKRFFGAARNMREGGSLTILATALVDTGSKMDDVVYEEFKGTGNMEIVLDRKLSEKRIFPAVDLAKSSTRREDLLLSADEIEAINIMRKALNGLKADEAADRILDMFSHTRNNMELVNMVRKKKFI